MARSTKQEVVLALDHGTSGCKTALVALSGELIDFEFAPTQTRLLAGGGAEQEPDDWWEAFLATAAKLVARGSVPPEAVVAVACSSTYSTTVAVNGEGKALGPALTWMDSRGAPYVAERMRGLVSVQGYGVRNVLRWVPKTGGGPTLSGKDDIAHVLWWQRERPEIYREAATFLGSKDYLNLRLTGRTAASFDSAALFWCTDNRNPKKIRYDDGLVRALGIDRAKLPPLRPATEVLGPLRPDVADTIGLPRNIPVIVGSPDLQSACVGSGAVRDFEAHLYVGTSSWLLCHVPFKKTDVLHSIASLPAAIPGRYIAANEQDTAGGALDFLVHKVLFPQDELRPAAPPEDIYERLDALANSVPTGSNGVLFTPWLNGEKSPSDDATLRGGFHNLSLSSTAADMTRAVYEGVAYNSRWLLGHVERFAGRRLDPLRFIGGGARSGTWCQIFSDVLERTIHQVADPLGANARGAAFLAGVALGRMSFEDVPGRVPVARAFQPRSAHREAHAERFAAFRELHRHNRGIYARLNRR